MQPAKIKRQILMKRRCRMHSQMQKNNKNWKGEGIVTRNIGKQGYPWWGENNNPTQIHGYPSQ